jgi:hypothetical protein
MATLTPEQIKGYASKAGFSGSDLDIAVAVALAESGGNTKAYNGNGKDRSYGLWQINMYGNMGPARQRQFALPSYDALYQPEVNAKAAKAIHKSQGWQRGWTTYANGAYLKHMDKAKGATATEPRDGIVDQVGDAVKGLNPVTGVAESINVLGTNVFKGVSNVAGILVAIALLVVGVVFLVMSSKGAKKAVNIAANVVPGGQVAKAGIKKVTKA